MKRKIIIEVTTRDRIQRQIKNSILAHASTVHLGGMANPETSLRRSDEIARLVVQDILRDYRLTPRK